MSYLNVTNVSHSFGGRQILENVSFKLQRGEHVGLVGANGEGLCKAVRGGLLCVLEVHAVVRAVSEKPLEARQVERRGDDKDIPYPCLHQN